MTPPLRERVYWAFVRMVCRALKRWAPAVLRVAIGDTYTSGFTAGYRAGVDQVNRRMRADLMHVQQVAAAQRSRDYLGGYRAGLAVQIAQTERAVVIAPQGESREFMWTTLPPRTSC
jgi:hypothetical protein